jgi:hypothetical protein
MLSITPENLPILTEIGSFQHRKELAKLRGRARGVWLQREQLHLEGVFRPSFSHFSCFTLSDCFTQRGTDVAYQGTTNPSNDIPVID